MSQNVNNSLSMRAEEGPHPEASQAADFVIRCSIPGFDGAISSREQKEALWARFSTAAPSVKGM
jgi:hypothetical protein